MSIDRKEMPREPEVLLSISTFLFLLFPSYVENDRNLLNLMLQVFLIVREITGFFFLVFYSGIILKVFQEKVLLLTLRKIGDF